MLASRTGRHLAPSRPIESKSCPRCDFPSCSRIPLLNGVCAANPLPDNHTFERPLPRSGLRLVRPWPYSGSATELVSFDAISWGQIGDRTDLVEATRVSSTGSFGEGKKRTTLALYLQCGRRIIPMLICRNSHTQKKLQRNLSTPATHQKPADLGAADTSQYLIPDSDLRVSALICSRRSLRPTDALWAPFGAEGKWRAAWRMRWMWVGISPRAATPARFGETTLGTNWGQDCPFRPNLRTMQAKG